jgi:hypothetical protein
MKMRMPNVGNTAHFDIRRPAAAMQSALFSTV